jgi:hypothetical protein
MVSPISGKLAFRPGVNRTIQAATLCLAIVPASARSQSETAQTLHRGTFEGTLIGAGSAVLYPGIRIDVYWFGYSQDGSEKVVSLLDDQPVAATGPAERAGEISLTFEITPQNIARMTQAQATGAIVYIMSDRP